MNAWFRQKYRRIFKNPSQLNQRYYLFVSICGRIGFLTKAFIYATIGGLTFESAVTAKVHNESPQGVFILLGSIPNASGHVLLIAMFIGIMIYATWRFCEGLTGQGYDGTLSKRKNFFRYRLSPLASGIVYVLYGIYVIHVLTIQPQDPGNSVQTHQETCFPLCWKSSLLGNIALGFLAVAFTIASITQLIPTFTGNFRNELDFSKFDNLFGKIVKYPFLISGHVGFFSRAVFFFLVCFLFWQIIFGNQLNLDPTQSTVAQAINNIRDTVWGRLVMAALGIGLMVYGLFAFACIYFKIFPTPPPSQNTTLPDENVERDNVDNV